MKIIRSIVSLLLALLVLVSSTSFALSTHTCRGHLKDISLTSEAQPCVMELMAKELGMEKSCGLSANGNCCQDRSVKFKGNDYNYKSGEHISLFSAILISAVLPQPLFELYNTDSSVSFSFTHFKPPLIERNIPVLVQSFLL